MGNGGLTPVRLGAGERGSQTAELLRAYRERGDSAARQRLVELYLPLVESFVRRYGRTTEDYDDLYQVGCIGLINAIDRFDPSRGDELAAFAVPNVAGEIRRYLRDRTDTVRLPRRVLELRSAASNTQADLRGKLGREPTTAEIAAELAAPATDVALALDGAASQALELQPDDSETGAEEIDAADDRLFLSEAFRGLDKRERRIIFMRYVRDAEPDAIAAELGISRRQLARNTEEALEKLRVGLESPVAASTRSARRSQPRPADGSEPKMGRTITSENETQGSTDQPYRIELVKSGEADGGWSAQVEELPGCVAHGATPQEAAAGAEAAIRDWIAEAEAHGREIPKPRSATSHSGRLLVRMPQSLHAELARAAEREEISLNQFITSSLASAVRWRGQGGDSAGPEQLPERRASEMRKALIANVLLLVVIAALAIALLVIAVSRG